jgi:pyrroline-5-carboxylate reductase
MKYAVLGGGRMGSALIRGMIVSGVSTGEAITLSSKHPESALKSATALGTRVSASNDDAVSFADVVFLCVKPNQSLGVLNSVATQLKGKLLISIVAGIQSEDLFAAAGEGIRIIRSMPNTAIRLRKGITAIAPSPSSTSEDLALALRIFSSVGTAFEVAEKDLDAVTAVSGSGPAFALLMLESLAQGGIEGGLNPETARVCAAGALSAAAALVIETAETPLALRQEITSPGGTTAAGLEVLVNSEFPSIVRDAVNAARHRSIELSMKVKEPLI